MTTNRATAYLSAEDQSRPAFESFRRNALSLNDTITSVGRNVAGFLSIATISTGLRATLNAAREAEQSEARLAATIRATGDAVGFTARELEGLNDELTAVSQFDDESIRNAQATFAKFGNIQGEVFEKGLRLAADYAAFVDSDLPSAAQTIGKALQSPTEGIGALERAIGKLAPSQERMIKDLVDSGKLFEAQGEVLKVVEQRVGGTARAFNTGLTKATADAGKEWSNLLEAIGRTDAVGVRSERALSGLASLMRDLRQEIEGTRTPLRELLIDMGKWGAGGIVGMIAARRYEAQDNEARRTTVGKITVKGAQDEEEAAARQRARLAREQAEIEADAERGVRNAVVLAKLRAEEEKKAADERKKALEEYGRLQRQTTLASIEETERALDGTTAIAIVRERIRDDTEAELRAEAELGRLQRERSLASIEESERALDGTTAVQIARQQMADETRRINDEAREGERTARELGLTFTSAFEDAAIAGKGLREVLKGMVDDISRIFLRKTITEPLAGFASGLFKDFDLGKLFSGFFAEGGFIPPGKWGIAGEAGPEPVFGGRTGATVVPNSGGGNVFIDARGADTAAVARLERMVRDVYRAVPRMSIDAVANARTRGFDV